MTATSKIRMKAPAPRRDSVLGMLFLYVVYVWIIIHTYDSQIAAENAYAGMQPWEMTPAGWIVLTIALPLGAFMAARVKGYPSDFFIVFYFSVPVISILALTSTSGKIGSSVLFPAFLIVAFPLLLILMLRRLVPKLRWRGVVRSIYIERTLLGILLAVVAFSLANSPASAGFDVVTSSLRRLEGRDLYTAGSLLAYALGMCMNGIAPYLAFRGAVSARPILVVTALGSVVFFFWLLGVKAPLMYVLMGYSIGMLARGNSLRSFVRYFLYSIVGIYFLIVVEWWLFDNYSLIADFGFRRLWAVQSEVQGFYLDFLMVDTPSTWNLLIGIPDPSFQATYYIGETYMGNIESNANTNAFLYAFVANGLFGYLLAVFFVGTFLVVLDRLYRSTRNPTYLFIGFIYGLLVLEQAFSTAMLSSGVGLLFLLTLLEKYDPRDAMVPRATKVKRSKFSGGGTSVPQSG